MLPRPPRSTRTYTLVPSTTLFRSAACEADEIADHPAAERDDMVAALDSRADQPFGQAREPFPAFRAFARRQDERGGRHALGRQRGGDAGKIDRKSTRLNSSH